MVAEGDDAPAFEAPAAKPNGDIEAVTLPEATADGPAVLAFFPRRVHEHLHQRDGDVP